MLNLQTHWQIWDCAVGSFYQHKEGQTIGRLFMSLWAFWLSSGEICCQTGTMQCHFFLSRWGIRSFSICIIQVKFINIISSPWRSNHHLSVHYVLEPIKNEHFQSSHINIKVASIESQTCKVVRNCWYYGRTSYVCSGTWTNSSRTPRKMIYDYAR